MYAVPAANNFIFRKTITVIATTACGLSAWRFVGNFIYLPTRQVGVIDFNRWDLGILMKNFTSYNFSRNVSPLFAYGQLQGYFAGKVPTLFWQFQKLYTFHAGLYS